MQEAKVFHEPLGAPGANLSRKFDVVGSAATDTQSIRPNPQQHVRRLNSCLLIDNTAATVHPSGPQNPRECHLYFAEGCHLYIALTGNVSTK